MKKFLYIISMLLILPNFLFAKNYKGAEYRTIDSFLYGRFEVRMKSANVSGMLSSFFTYHELGSNGVADWNEIDIEIMGRKSDEVQFNTITPNQINHTQEQKVKFNPHDGFHTYAIEWTPDYVAWYVDGFEVYRQTGDHIKELNKPQKLMMNIWPPDNPGWAGNLDPNNLPVYAYYDWVKYYRYEPKSENQFVLEWTDELNEWDISRWQKATHTWYGNNADFVKENIVFKDGYMILCLTNSSNLGYNGGNITEPDITAPYLAEAYKAGNKVYLDFSEPLNKTIAETKTNYVISGLNVLNATYDENKFRVTLSTETTIISENYVVIPLNIADKAGNKIVTAAKNIVNIISDSLTINAGLYDNIWSSNEPYGFIGGIKQENKSESDELFKYYIEGLNTYKIRAKKGKYALNLYFEDPQNDINRIFNVYINGTLVAQNYNIASNSTNGKAILVAKSVTVENEMITIYFESVKGNPLFNGVKAVNTDLTSVNDSRLPESFNLKTYPNPFNPSAIIEYTLKDRENVSLKIYNSLGQLIMTKYFEYLSAGVHKFRFNAKGYSSGVYFINVQAGTKSKTSKILYLK